MPKIDGGDSVFRKKGTGRSFYASAQDSNADRARKFLLRNAVLIGVVILMVVVWAVIRGAGDSWQSELVGQRGEIASLKQQVSVEEAKSDKALGAAVSEATGGVDLEHQRSDDEKMSQLMTTALTWKGLREYLQRRDQVMRDYSFAADSPFMTVFMPGEEQGVTRTAPSGKTYSSFDEDMSSKFSSLKSYVTGVSGEVYSYFAVVEMLVSSSSGAAAETGYVAMTYDMIEGKPANLDAWTTPGGVTTSG